MFKFSNGAGQSLFGGIMPVARLLQLSQGYSAINIFSIKTSREGQLWLYRVNFQKLFSLQSNRLLHSVLVGLDQ